jgi:hypothetical protein
MPKDEKDPSAATVPDPLTLPSLNRQEIITEVRRIMRDASMAISALQILVDDASVLHARIDPEGAAHLQDLRNPAKRPPES